MEKSLLWVKENVGKQIINDDIACKTHVMSLVIVRLLSIYC